MNRESLPFLFRLLDTRVGSWARLKGIGVGSLSFPRLICCMICQLPFGCSYQSSTPQTGAGRSAGLSFVLGAVAKSTPAEIRSMKEGFTVLGEIRRKWWRVVLTCGRRNYCPSRLPLKPDCGSTRTFSALTTRHRLIELDIFLWNRLPLQSCIIHDEEVVARTVGYDGCPSGRRFYSVFLRRDQTLRLRERDVASEVAQGRVDNSISACFYSPTSQFDCQGGTRTLDFGS